MKKRATFKVTLDVPDGATVDSMCEYVANAVMSWKGGIDPERPEFDLDADTVRVTYERGSIKANRQDEETESILTQFRELGDKASTHFASNGEWAKGYDAKRECLKLFDAHPELHVEMREIAGGFLWSLWNERPGDQA